jgi:hypothetical protein
MTNEESLRLEIERLTARLNFSKNDFEITKLQAALQGARSRGDEMAARAESAERKLVMAVEAFHWIDEEARDLISARLHARSAAAELEKADG